MNYETCHDRDWWIELSRVEFDEAARHGMALRKFSLANGHRDKKGFGHRPPTAELALRMQVLGAVSEAIVRKALGFTVALKAQAYGEPDLPNNVEVRLITHEHYGLRVYPNDPNERKVVGVVITEGNERAGRYRIPGWIYAGNARLFDEWVMAPYDGPPMWAVPQDELWDARELLTQEGRRDGTAATIA